ncbi:MAG: Asp-tRNA(Asn)/Glu-tRNA(Gln) amidotransferase subunit GatC [Nitrososphaerales archaeon]
MPLKLLRIDTFIQKKETGDRLVNVLVEGKGRISKKEIEHIAWLARIELSKKEMGVFSKQLNEILAYFTKIDKVDTEDIPPSYHVLDFSNVFREDEVKPSMSEENLRNVPQTKGRFVKAPRMT